MTQPSAPATDGLISAGRRNLRAIAHAVSHPSHAPTPLFDDAPQRWQRLLPYGAVLLLACALLPVTIHVLTADYGVPGGLAGALATAQTVPMLMIGHRPLQAWWIILPADVIGGLFVLGLPDTQSIWPWSPPVIVGYLFLMLALALRETRRTLIGVWLVTGLVGLLLGQFFPARNDGTNLLMIVLSAVVLVVGGALRERGDVQRRLTEQETISEAERSQRTLLEERTRIARELHDVVAHHMSVITVQADSAPYRVGDLSPAAREEFTSIAASARESLTEMRRLLSVLRSEDSKGGGERAPQPGLDRVQQLVEATVRAGVPAELSLAADVGPMPQTVDLSAYRIVQEALANVVRHAPGAATRVSVRSDGADLTVLIVNGPAAVRDSGRAAPVEARGAGGHGLVGMRERVRLTGGTLDIGPLPDGGFRVAARIPIAAKGSPSS